MSPDHIPEDLLLKFGFERMVRIDDPKKKYWAHPTFGELVALPTHRQLLDHVFNLAWNRASKPKIGSS